MKKFFNVVIIAKENAQKFVQTSNARRMSKNNYPVVIKLIWIVVIRLKMLFASVTALISLLVGISANASVEIAKKLVMVLVSKNVEEG